MRPTFLYGTLLDDGHRDIVLGPGITARRATLVGYGVFWALGESYPRIAEADGSITGLLIEDAEARARMTFYEGGYGYDLRQVTVDTDQGAREAEVFWPGPDVPPPGDPWSLHDWQAAWGPLVRHAAAEAMESYRAISAQTLAARMPMIRSRAHSAVLARQKSPVPPLGPLPQQAVEELARRRPYTNFFSLLEAELRVPRFDGTMSAVVNRAAFQGVDAAVVLPYDPVRDRVLLIEQFRMAPYFRGEASCFTIEAVAGRVDAGETPEATAARELAEEAGLTFSRLHKVSEHYPSTGAYTEYIYVYVAIVDLPDGSAALGGVATEHEDIRSSLLDYGDFEARLDADAFDVGPLILAGYWLARHRAHLRA